MSDQTRTLYVTGRGEWRKWLQKNHGSEKEIWLVHYKKCSKKPRIPYDDAVEEALCFGWIDSTVRHLDDKRFIQRFTPRKKGSIWSVSNRRRMRKMIKEGKMTPAGLEAFKHLRRGTSKDQLALRVADALTPTADLRSALMRNKTAWRNFQAFAPTHRKLYIWWVATAKRPETRKKRISITVKRCAQNKKPNEI